jgi:hypothetical protein
MKTNIKIFTFILFFALIFSFASASDVTQGSSAGEFVKVGAAGSQFLKIDLGARANGMGGAYGAVANDLTSIYWNPAGLADVRAISANFSYTQWFANFNHMFAAVSMPLGENFTTALHMVSFGCNNIEITTMDVSEGTQTYYSVNDLAVGLSLSGYLTEEFSFGVTAKYISNSFANLNANGISFDVGTMYKTGIQGITLGFSIHNLGPEMQFSGQNLNTTVKLNNSLDAAPLDAQYLSSSYSIPLTFRAGISSEVYNDETNRILGALDFVTQSDSKEQYILGAEYTWNSILSLRGGYKIGSDQLGLAGGVGINYIGGGFSGQVDYSIAPTKDLGLVNRISVALNIK